MILLDDIEAPASTTTKATPRHLHVHVAETNVVPALT
jgi:hypothetical protein